MSWYESSSKWFSCSGFLKIIAPSVSLDYPWKHMPHYLYRFAAERKAKPPEKAVSFFRSVLSSLLCAGLGPAAQW